MQEQRRAMGQHADPIRLPEPPALLVHTTATGSFFNPNPNPSPNPNPNPQFGDALAALLADAAAEAVAARP